MIRYRPLLIGSAKRRRICDTPVGSPPTADIHINYRAVTAAPSQGRLYCSAKNELPILFEDIEKGCVIRGIFLDGKVANLV